MPKNKFTLWEKDEKIMLDQSGTPYGYIPTWWKASWDFDSGLTDRQSAFIATASVRVSFYMFYGVLSGRIFAKTISQNSQNRNCDVTVERTSIDTLQIIITKGKNTSPFASKGEITLCVDPYFKFAATIEQDLEQHPEEFVPSIRTSLPTSPFPNSQINCNIIML
jgi:hypothetical protein